MKTLKLLSIFLICITITSCTIEEDSNTITFNASNLIGTYDMSSFSSVETESETNNGVSTITRYETVGTSFNASFTFNANGSYTSNGSYDYTEEEFVNGALVDSDNDTENLNNAGTYTITNNTITLNSNGESTTFLVAQFNSTDFILQYSETDTDSSFNVEIGLTRQ